jgi:hypothetical protein
MQSDWSDSQSSKLEGGTSTYDTADFGVNVRYLKLISSVLAQFLYVYFCGGKMLGGWTERFFFI